MSVLDYICDKGEGEEEYLGSWMHEGIDYPIEERGIQKISKTEWPFSREGSVLGKYLVT